MRTLAPLLVSALVACAPSARASLGSPAPGAVRMPSAMDTTGAAAVAERWWRAFTLGDTATLRQHTARRVALTLSNGQTLDRDRMLREAATHVPKATTFVDPATDVSVLPLAGAVTVTSSVREGSQGGSNTFRYLTVLERPDSVWSVVAAHSTRALTLTPRVSATTAGPLADYAGRFRGQGGRELRIVVRDSALGLIDPSGAESRLEPIGPALFELPRLYDGIAVVRFAFARDATGQVTNLSRMLYGSVVSWPRIPQSIAERPSSVPTGEVVVFQKFDMRSVLVATWSRAPA